MLRILAFDGGPGPILQMFILERLVEGEFPELLATTDLFAGTSNGGLMALYLALHLGRGQSSVQAVQGCLAFALRVTQAFAADTRPLEFVTGKRPFTVGHAFCDLLREEFGTVTLADLKRHVVITSFDTQDWTPRIYRNFGDDLERDGPLELVDVALATSSLPLITPIHGGHGDRGYLDGIVCANNPSLSAVSLAARSLIAPGLNPLDEMTVLSLGVVQSTEEASMERAGGVPATLALLFSQSRDVRYFFAQLTFTGRWGYLISKAAREASWSQPNVRGVGGGAWGWYELFFRRPTFLLNLLLHGHIGEVDRQCRRLLSPGRYFRYQPRVNLMRDVMNYLVDRGRRARPAMAWTAGRCFGEHPTVVRSADEVDNIKDTQALVAWLRQQGGYVPGSTTENSANSPSADATDIVPP